MTSSIPKVHSIAASDPLTKPKRRRHFCRAGLHRESYQNRRKKYTRRKTIKNAAPPLIPDECSVQCASSLQKSSFDRIVKGNLAENRGRYHCSNVRKFENAVVNITELINCLTNTWKRNYKMQQKRNIRIQKGYKESPEMLKKICPENEQNWNEK